MAAVVDVVMVGVAAGASGVRRSQALTPASSAAPKLKTIRVEGFKSPTPLNVKP